MRWGTTLYAAVLAALVAGCSAGGGGVFFNEDLDVRAVLKYLAFILIFASIWEATFEVIEEKLEGMDAYKAMLHHVKEELVLVGFISATVLFVNEFGMISNQDELIAFEVAHFVIFFAMVFHIIGAVIQIKKLATVKNRWDRFSMESVEDACKWVEEHDKSKKGETFPISSVFYENQDDDWHAIEWKVFRIIFLTEFKLGSNFDYARYMRTKLNNHVIHEELHVHPLTYIIMVILMLFWFALWGGVVEPTPGFVHDNTTIQLVARRQLGGGGTKYNTDVGMISGQHQWWAVSAVTFVLLFSQIMVLVIIKKGLHAVLAAKGASNLADLPKVLRKLSKELEDNENASVQDKNGQLTPTVKADTENPLNESAEGAEGEEAGGSADGDGGHGGGGHGGGHGGHDDDDPFGHQHTAADEFAHHVCGGGLDQYSHGLQKSDDAALADAQNIFSASKYGWCNFVAEICSLVNCYLLAYYLFHGIMIIEGWYLHILIAVPATLNMFYTSPRMAMNFCMLTSILYKDNEAVAQTLAGMEEIRETRNKLRETLLKIAKRTFAREGRDNDAWDEYTATPEFLVAVARKLFQKIDRDGSGTIEFKELERWCPKVGVYLTTRDFRAVARFIDADKSGDLTEEEWTSFINASDDELLKTKPMEPGEE